MDAAYPNPSQIVPLYFKINRAARIRFNLTENSIAAVTTGWTWQLTVKRYAGELNPAPLIKLATLPKHVVAVGLLFTASKIVKGRASFSPQIMVSISCRTCLSWTISRSKDSGWREWKEA